MPARDSTDLIRGDRENLYDVEDWLSPSQAGRLLGTSGQWVTELCRRGRLRAVRTALGWLVDPDEIEDLAEEREKKAEAKLEAIRERRRAGSPGRAEE